MLSISAMSSGRRSGTSASLSSMRAFSRLVSRSSCGTARRISICSAKYRWNSFTPISARTRSSIDTFVPIPATESSDHRLKSASRL